MTGSVTDCEYTCQSCDYVWHDTKQRGYEHMAYEYCGCPECKSKDVKWEERQPDAMTEEQLKALHAKMNEPGGKLGKPPKDFVENVLGRIHDNHKGYRGDKSSINLDW